MDTNFDFDSNVVKLHDLVVKQSHRIFDKHSHQDEFLNTLDLFCESIEDAKKLVIAYRIKYNSDLVQDCIKQYSSFSAKEESIYPLIAIGLVSNKSPYNYLIDVSEIKEEPNEIKTDVLISAPATEIFKYCCHCGKPIEENQEACLMCGCDPMTGNEYCYSCGVKINPNQIICIQCRVSLKDKTRHVAELKQISPELKQVGHQEKQNSSQVKQNIPPQKQSNIKPLNSVKPISHELKWYQKQTGIILLLLIFFPVGLFFMWKNGLWSAKARWIITAIFPILLLNSAIGNTGSYDRGISERMYLNSNGSYKIIELQLDMKNVDYSHPDSKVGVIEGKLIENGSWKESDGIYTLISSNGHTRNFITLSRGLMEDTYATISTGQDVGFFEHYTFKKNFSLLPFFLR